MSEILNVWKGGCLLKKKITAWVLMVSISAILSACTNAPGESVKDPEKIKVTVFNPLGQPPAIKRVPMASRINDLKGKTIYIVDIGFSGTHQFLTELQDILKEKYPDTNWPLRDKVGTYFNDDPKLWTEIKEKGDAMIMGVGH